MTKKSLNEIRDSLLRALHQIAPEADLQKLNFEVNFREELEIDSMDFLRLMVRLHDELKIDIPEAAYPKLVTLKGCLEYLDSKINCNYSAQ